MTKTFAVSPAYFDFSSCSRAEKEQNEKIVDGWIKDRMPDAAKSNAKVFALFKMCIASLEHHRSFLDENLHSHSNVRASIFMLETAPFADYVTSKYPWDKTSDTPEITGIPPDVLVLAEFESMRTKMDEMKISIGSDFEKTLKKELDDREVGGTVFTKMSEKMRR